MARGYTIIQEELAAERSPYWEFWILVACVLVNCTRGKSARPILHDLMRIAPRPWDLAVLPVNRLLARISGLGFGLTRAQRLRELAIVYHQNERAGIAISGREDGEGVMENGEVGILNVGAGDVKLSFDPANMAERIRAARIVKDMIRRGYALIIKVSEDGKEVWRRATDFREDTCEYIIADLDPAPGALERNDEEVITGPETSETDTPSSEAGASARQKASRRGRGRAIAAERTTGVAVSRTAGG